MAGNPDAVLAGAAALAGAAEAFTSSAEGVRAAGNELSAGWSGAAAASAGDVLTRIGTSATVPADVVAAARPILETYAQALREAQEKFALGERRVEEGARTQLTEALQPTSRANDQVLGQAAARVAEGEAMQAEAVAAEQQANDAAATGIEGLTAQLASMSIPTVGGAGGAAGPGPAVVGPGNVALPGFGPPPAAVPAEEDQGLSISDVGHALLDVGGLFPVLGEPLDLVNAAWYGAEGDYVSAALSGGAAIPIAGGKVLNRGVKLVDSAGDARVWLKNRPPMVPDHAQRVPFRPDQHFPAGDKFRWPSSRTPGKTMEYRSHGPDPRIEPPNNAGVGPVYRITDNNGKEFLGTDGVWYRDNAFKPNSPHHVPTAANDTHMPLPGHLPPPGAARILLPNPVSLADGVGDGDR